MKQPQLKPGMRVRIIAVSGRYRDPSWLGKETTIVRSNGDRTNEWILQVDGGYAWWAPEHLKVICCGAKGCISKHR